MAQRFARARAADVGEILETLRAMSKAQRDPPFGQAAPGQPEAEGTFLP